MAAKGGREFLAEHIFPFWKRFYRQRLPTPSRPRREAVWLGRMN